MNIPLFKTYSDEKDKEYIKKVIERGMFWAIGPEVEEFEKKVADYIGVKYALAFNSGTSALHTLLLAHNVKGKEVIVPSFTFIATANAVVLAEGIPVFVESESETLGIDINSVRDKINENTKAIIALHYGGFVQKDIEDLRKLADEKNILLIEDAAESMGAHINNKKAGSFGDSAILSFCQNKIISTGEGGMLLTNSEEIYEKSKLIRSHGRLELNENYFSSTQDNDYLKVGYNYRLSTILSSLGLAQFEKIDFLINKRREIAQRYNQAFDNISKITTLKEREGHFYVYQMYSIILDNNETRDKLQKYLKEKGVMTKVYFNPVHLKSIYKKEFGCNENDLPKTEEISKTILTLPMYPDLIIEEQNYIIACIKDYFGENNERNV